MARKIIAEVQVVPYLFLSFRARNGPRGRSESRNLRRWAAMRYGPDPTDPSARAYWATGRDDNGKSQNSARYFPDEPHDLVFPTPAVFGGEGLIDHAVGRIVGLAVGLAVVDRGVILFGEFCAQGLQLRRQLAAPRALYVAHRQ